MMIRGSAGITRKTFDSADRLSSAAPPRKPELTPIRTDSAVAITPASRPTNITPRVPTRTWLKMSCGAPGTTGVGTDTGSKPPVNQVMDSILGMALQLPALKSIGDSIGMDFSSAITPPSDPQAGTPTKRSTK